MCIFLQLLLAGIGELHLFYRMTITYVQKELVTSPWELLFLWQAKVISILCNILFHLNSITSIFYLGTCLSNFSITFKEVQSKLSIITCHPCDGKAETKLYLWPFYQFEIYGQKQR